MFASLPGHMKGLFLRFGLPRTGVFQPLFNQAADRFRPGVDTVVETKIVDPRQEIRVKRNQNFGFFGWHGLHIQDGGDYFNIKIS